MTNITHIKVKNLSLRTWIGFQEWEKKKKQDILVNIHVQVKNFKTQDLNSDSPPFNYKQMTKKIIQEVEEKHFLLLEKLVSYILDLILEDKNIIKATVEVDKPHALRFAESVSVTMNRERAQK